MNKANEKLKSLESIDRRVAVLDGKFFRLIIERFEHAMELGRIKQRLREKLRNSRRETEVLHHVSSIPCRFLSKQVVRSIYRVVMTAARELEAETKVEQSTHPLRQTRSALLQAKKKHRTMIDKLDSEIVRVLDARMHLAASLGFVNVSTAIQECHAEKLRERICTVNANSEIKQWIWQIVSCALGRKATLVATPIRAHQLLGGKNTAKGSFAKMHTRSSPTVCAC